MGAGDDAPDDDDAPPAAGPAGPPPAAHAWYYANPATGQPTGPYPEPTFAALARAGAMPLETPVWRAGLEWKPLATHGPGVLGIPAVTLRQAARAAKDEADRRVGGGAAAGAGEQEEEEEAALAAPADHPAAPPAADSAPPSPPPDERRFVEDGIAFEWDSRLRRFVEVGEQAGVPAPAKAAGKRSAADVLERRGGGGGLKKAPPAPSSGATTAGPAPPPPPPRPPVTVYVTGLPTDTTEAEVAAVFGKCGLIRPAKADPSGRTPAVRLYRGAGPGAPLKGDATITFLRPPSVDLAITLLDGVPLRAGAGGAQPVMSVSVAKFEGRGGEGADAPSVAAAHPPPTKRARGPGGKGGGGRPPPPAGGAAALAAKALAWDGFDDEAPPEATTVVARWGDGAESGGARLLASLIEGGKDAVAAFEASLAAVCGRAVGASVGAGGGAVEAVRAFLGEPTGLVATVRFRTPEGAAAAVARLAGKPLTVDGPPVVSVELWDGVTGFRARPPKKVVAGEAEAEAGAAAVARAVDDDDDDEDDQARLDRFGADLFGE